MVRKWMRLAGYFLDVRFCVIAMVLSSLPLLGLIIGLVLGQDRVVTAGHVITMLRFCVALLACANLLGMRDYLRYRRSVLNDELGLHGMRVAVSSVFGVAVAAALIELTQKLVIADYCEGLSADPWLCS